MECEMCDRGSFTLCTRLEGRLLGFTLPGSHAEQVKVPRHIASSNTYKFKEAAPEEIACAEPLASVIHALDRVRPRQGETAAVVGAGALGLMFLQLMKREGVRVLVANRSEERLGMAEKLGADEVMKVGSELPEKVRDSTKGLGADLVVEAVGTKETWESSFKATRPGGRTLMFGGCAAGTEVAFDAGRVHYGETTIVGSFHHEPSAFRRAVEAIEARQVLVAPFITHRMKLEQIREAFDLMERREAMKVALSPR